MPGEPEATDFSPEAIVRAAFEGSLEELADTAAMDLEGAQWQAFADTAAALHNAGKIDLLAAASAAEGEPDWGGERLYGDTFPLLDAPLSAMFDAMSALAARTASGEMPYFAQDAFSKWAAKDKVRADGALSAVRSGSAPETLLIPALNAGVRAARADYMAILVSMMREGSGKEAESAAFVLGNAEPADASERQLIEGALTLGLADDNGQRRAAAFRAMLSIGVRTPEDEALALAAIDAVEAGASAEIRVATANALFMARSKLSEPLVTRMCGLLRGTPKGEPATVRAIDNAISQHLAGGTAAPRLALLRHLLGSGAATLAAMDSTAYRILGDKNGLRAAIVAEWLAEGTEEMVQAVHDLVMRTANQPPTFDLDFSTYDLDPERTAAIGRMIVSSLVLFPETAASVILSLLKTGHADAAPALEEILYDPLLISYWEGPRSYLLKVAPDQPPEIAALLERAIGRLDAYIAAIRAAGIIAEFGPSERQRFLYQALRQEEQRKIQKGVKRKSVFANLFATKVLLYGDSAITKVYRGDGEGTRQEFRLGTIEHSQEIARLDAIDPFGFWYQRFLLSIGRTS